MVKKVFERVKSEGFGKDNTCLKIVDLTLQIHKYRKVQSNINPII